MRTPKPTFRNIVDPVLAAEYRAAGWWGDLTVSDRVSALSSERPAAPAFVTPEHRMTWADYDAQARRLATVLVASGLDAGERVAVLLPDGATVHVAFVATERAGLTIVGLSSRAGDLELQSLLRKTAATCLVSLVEHRGRDTAQICNELRVAGVPIRTHVVVPCFEADPDGAILVDGEPVEGATAEDEALDARRMGPDDLFLLNSTSGTTGLPKCVTHTQNRWLYFSQKAIEHGGLTGADVMFGAVPAPFGFGLWTEHFAPALLGIPTVLMERFSAEQTLELIEREHVTVLGCVTSQFLLMLNSPRFGATDFSSLRVMFTGGEAVPLERAREWEQRTGSRLLQFFGSNETGMLSGTRIDDTEEQRLTTCGRIVPEMQVRLFEDGHDTTLSRRGQPACRGPATSVGYFEDPDANAALFTDDGWMLTGDICEMDTDGYLTVVGRKSDIIIRGGKNISAPEVERYVATHPRVALVAAMAMPDDTLGERVCVYVQLSEGTDLTVEELAGHLAAIGVSKELFPEGVVVLDELPLSSGGKVAKAELRADVQHRRAG